MSCDILTHCYVELVQKVNKKKESHLIRGLCGIAHVGKDKSRIQLS